MKCWTTHHYVTGPNVTCNRCVYCGEHKLITAIRDFLRGLTA